MNTQDITPALDLRARADYRQAAQHLSARTVAELHRRRIAAVAAHDSRRSAGQRFGWPLAAAMGGVCALALSLGVLLPSMPQDAPAAIAELDALEALEAINLTALDEDSDFFLWLATHETSLLAME